MLNPNHDNDNFELDTFLEENETDITEWYDDLDFDNLLDDEDK